MSLLDRGKREAYHGFVIIIAAAVLLAVISATQYRFFHDTLEVELEEKAEAELTMKSIVTRSLMRTMEKTLVGHIWDMKRELHHPDSMFNIARWIVKSNPSVLGCGFAFRPYYYPQKGPLFGLYAQHVNGKIEVHELSDSAFDYTKEGLYPIALKAHRVEGDRIGKKNGCWLEPYYEQNIRQNTITYTLPIWEKDTCFVGFFSLELSLAQVGDTLNRRHLYPSSYDLLLSENGALLAGPAMIDENRHKIENVVSIINDSTIEKSTTRAGRGTMVNFEEPGGRKGLVFYRSFSGEPNWQIAVVCYEDEVFEDLKRSRTKTLVLSLFGLMVLALILYLAIRNILKLQRANMEQERINSELQIASKIQKEMLLEHRNGELNLENLDIACYLVPAKEVGGDLYEYLLRNEKLFFCIGDVSGKGVPSAIVMAVVHSVFRMAISREDNPERIVKAINEVSCHNNHTSMFVTMFVGVLDLETGQLAYCNAGHNPPFILGRGQLDVIANFPIGLYDDFDYHMQQIQLFQGDMLFLYTDGLTEAMNVSHQQFGMQRVEEILKDGTNQSPKQLLASMSAGVNEYMQGTNQSDDLTMMAIRYIGRPEGGHNDEPQETNI